MASQTPGATAPPPADREPKLHVLYLSDVYFPRVNGVSTSIATFRRELPAWGVETRLLAPAYGPASALDGVVRLPGRPVPTDPEDRFVTPWRFERAGLRVEADLIHVQTPFSAHRAGVRLARARHLPVVETWHTDFEHYFEHYLRFVPASLARSLARHLARRIGRSVDHLVVPSIAVARQLVATGVRTPATVLPTGMVPGELGMGDGRRFRARLGIDPARPVAVHVGRVAHEKNLYFLLDAADLVRREVPEFRLVIAGEGPALGDLRRRVGELRLGEHVVFVGYLDRQRDLADCYRAGDLFAFTSQTETQGLVLLEAMSLGVPVVALAARGTTDLLAAGLGALTPAPRVDEFARSVVRLLRDPGLRHRLGREAKEVAAHWTAGVFAGQLASLYRRLATRSVTARAAAKGWTRRAAGLL